MSKSRTMKLSEIADIITGATPSSKYPEAWGDEMPFITPSDQIDSTREATPTRFLSAYGAALLKKRLIPAGTTNLTCIGSTIGKVSMAMSPAVTNQQINSIIAKKDIADPTFVYYMIKNWSGILKVEAAGSATPIINKTVLSNYLFKIPPLSEQRAIAEVLGALDDKITANNKLMHSIDEFLKALFKSVSSHSLVRSLHEVATVNPSTVTPTSGGHLRYIDISSVNKGYFDFPDKSSWEDAPSRARRQVQSSDIIWSTVRPSRQSHALILDDDDLLVASTGLAVIRSNDNSFAYLYEATKAPMFSGYLESVADGSTYPAVRADLFNMAPILWATKTDREYFESIAAPLRYSAQNFIVENRILEETRDTLLPLLMSGKIQVREAESIVENTSKQRILKLYSD